MTYAAVKGGNDPASGRYVGGLQGLMTAKLRKGGGVCYRVGEFAKEGPVLHRSLSICAATDA